MKHNIYLKSMGKMIKITHIATSTKEVNEICNNDSNIGILAEDGDLFFLADISDKGWKNAFIEQEKSSLEFEKINKI